MKSFADLKEGDKLYLYNGFSKTLHELYIEEALDNKETGNLEISFSDDDADHTIYVKPLGRDKTRINLSEKIILSTQPIQ